MVRSTNVGGFHGATLLGAEDAVDHETSSQAENLTVITDPVLIWKLFDPVAALVHWDVTKTAKDDHVFIFVISAVANNTLGIFLRPMLTIVVCIRL